ncbi:MAG: magnesium and cobalt transport protein CorA [Marinilabiliales bacterium]|nr:MAG: magnesium and cobalt transport protein CorA [Marinilabiliales bacterium]
MARYFKKRHQALGQVPGSLIFIGEKKMDVSRIRLIQYNQDELIENELSSVDEVQVQNEGGKVSWINIDGIQDLDLIKKAGKLFAFHPLMMEDLVSTAQRPKMEDFDDNVFVSMKMLTIDNKSKTVATEQIGLVLMERILITFQEQVGDVFEPVRDRIRKSKGKIRNSGSDYLLYALLDTIVDNYITIIESFGEQIDEFEDKIAENQSKKMQDQLHFFKKEIRFLLKVVKPVSELVSNLLRNDSQLIKDENLPFFRDLNDLVIHAVESIETYKSLLKDYQDLFDNGVNNKMNDIMKVLTIFSSIFIPLTFIAGIYGTNFDNVPELHYKYGYFIMWFVMIVIAVVMILFFKRKKWL